MAGIRTAAVWTIGAATLSTTVGQPSLGDLIFAGLQTQNWTLVLVGCVAAAALALAARRAAGRWSNTASPRAGAAGCWSRLGVLLVGVLARAAPRWPRVGTDVTIGAKNFSEQYILARLIGHRLEAAGYEVRYREGLGSAVVFGALAAGDVDVYVDYAGTLWTNEMNRTDVPERRRCSRAIAGWAAETARHRLSVRSVSKMPMPLRCAATMRSARGIASLDDLARARRGSSSAPISNFSNAPNGRRCARLSAAFRAPTPITRPSCTARSKAARSM